MNAETSQPAIASPEGETATRFVDLWPPAVIAVGGLATLAWGGCLVWGTTRLLIHWLA
jgi:hypothetical protein